MEITVKKPSRQELDELGVNSWPVWEKEESSFDWNYSSREDCYILEGEARIDVPDGKSVTIRKGEFVSFPKGLKCRWNVLKKIKKHYNFS